jgi:hypothetical protein
VRLTLHGTNVSSARAGNLLGVTTPNQRRVAGGDLALAVAVGAEVLGAATQRVLTGRSLTDRRGGTRFAGIATLQLDAEANQEGTQAVPNHPHMQG